MSLGTFIMDSLEQHTHDDVIDVFAAAEELGFQILPQRFDDSIKKGAIRPTSDADYFGDIVLANGNSEAEDRTIIALLMAKHLIAIGANLTPKLSFVDIFFLSDLRNVRMSSQLMLATRLAIPERVIEKLDDLRFNSDTYVKKSTLLPLFVASAFYISGSSLLGLLQNLDLVAASRMQMHNMPARFSSSMSPA